MVDAWLLAVATFLAWLGLKPLPVAAGFFGGAISGGLLPGPLAAIFARAAVRITVGAFCGGLIAGWGAQALADSIGRPDALGIVALGLGIGGLSFCFKVLEAWNALDLGKYLKALIEKFTPGRPAE